MTLAYLDPGSGSLIASALVGGVAAAGVVAKQARTRLGSLGRKKKDRRATTVDRRPCADEDATTAGPTAEAVEATTDAGDAPADEPTTVSSDT